MAIFSVNKFMTELKEKFPQLKLCHLLLNKKLFYENKFKYTQGPILLAKLVMNDETTKDLTNKELDDLFGSSSLICIHFPNDYNGNYLICSIDANKKASTKGPYFERSFNKVGASTLSRGIELTTEYEHDHTSVGKELEL